LFVVEGGRIFVEALGTRSMYRPARVPFGLLWRAHVIGYSLAFYMPAGRATAETVKATMMAKCATPARATAIAAVNQSLALLGLALAALACLIGAATVPGSAKIVGGLAVVAGVTGTLAILLRAATLRLPSGWLRRFSPRVGSLVDDAKGEVPAWFPAFPLAMFVVNRALQLVSLAILLHAVGGNLSVQTTLVAGGVNLVGASLGDMVPGQLGATDATFSVSSNLLGLTASKAISIALVVHVVQITWMAIGILTEVAVRAAGLRQPKRVM
jgi:hypothetical protein